ncbi:hypothetical protein [Lachnospira multipara]|uniref:Uncharacterized protein n=1 Tax=Lachnospira multipara TaxID=28051 RepID=A0A1H5VSU4_9FIRM|nr:hypothetical protein [Lachnospira multipara]SEF90379.1 hypothetical protein SAMN05216537_11278 [Lachnospira multipara]
MIGIKDMEEMPKGCCEFHKDTDMVLHCPLYNSCDKRTTIKVNFKPVNCPLVEIITCKDCKYNNENTCDLDGYGINDDYFCASGERKVN